MSVPDLSLKLLQALNDRKLKTVDECTKDKSAKEWINNQVDQKHIENAIFTCKIQYKDITCLCCASGHCNTRTVQQLVQAGADVNITDSIGNTPLHWVSAGKIEVKQKVEYLLSCEASLIRAQNISTNTPLLEAAVEGNSQAISVLIKHGAAVNERGEFNRTALHQASGYGHVACIHELMVHGADVEARDSYNNGTPLQVAANFNRPACARFLLEKCSASINATNQFGHTALHRAAYKGNLEVFKLLREYKKCDVNVKNVNGETAADVAKRKFHANIVDYLKAQSSVASVTSSMAASNITDDRKIYGKYMHIYICSCTCFRF